MIQLAYKHGSCEEELRSEDGLTIFLFFMYMSNDNDLCHMALVRLFVIERSHGLYPQVLNDQSSLIAIDNIMNSAVIDM